MKNSIYNKREVPSVHSGCSLAETGAGDYDDFDNRLEDLDIIPDGKEISFVRNEDSYRYDGEEHVNVELTLPPKIQNPSSVREEPLVIVVVPVGVHPFTFLKEKGVNMEKSWIFMHNDVVDMLRKMPYRYHQATVAYGEFFRFESFDEISLQDVKYFKKWKILLEGKICGKELYRTDTPERIIEVVMEK